MVQSVSRTHIAESKHMRHPMDSNNQCKSLVLSACGKQPPEVYIYAGSVQFEVFPLLVNKFLIQKANCMLLLEKLKWSISRKGCFLTFKAVASGAE